MTARDGGKPADEAAATIDTEALKQAFVECVANGALGLPIEELFEHLPGVSFWVKNRDLRFVMGTQSFSQLCGRLTPADIIGRTDLDLFPTVMAEKFRADDREVLRTGDKRLNIVELVPQSDGTVDWYSTNKFPVFGRDGAIVGVAGTTRLLRKGGRILQPYQELSEIIDFISRNHQKPLEVRALAERAGVSMSQLERRFKELLQITPAQFITKMRLTAACKALAYTREPVSQIAAGCGFYDASHFCRVFAKHIGITPTEYRSTYLSGRGIAA